MATLSKEQKKNLKEVGITTAKTVEEGEQAMKDFLKGHDLDTDDEDFDELYEMSALMYSDSDDENDDLADEVEEKETAERNLYEESLNGGKSKKAAPAAEDEEDDDDEEEKSEPAETEAEPVEAKKEEKPKPKPKAKTAPKKSAKVSKSLNPKVNPEDAKKFDALKKVLDDSLEVSLKHNFIANGGLTVKYSGANGNRVLFSYDSPKRKEDEILARVYFPAIKNEEKLRELFGEDFQMKPDWSNNILIHNVPLNEFTDLISNNIEFIENIVGGLSKKDEKLGKNRQKMEDDLKSKKKEKASSVKPKKETAEKEVPEETPEEAPEAKEEAPEPTSEAAPAKKETEQKKTVKKAAKKAPAKKAPAKKTTKKAPVKKAAAKK